MRAAILAVLAAVVLAVAVPTAPVGAATPGTLAGTVTRAGAPLAGTPVWVYRADAQVRVATTTTAADGTWSRSLDPGTYRVLVWATAAGLPATWYPGAPLWADAGIVHVRADATTTVDHPVAEPAALAGTVTAAGAPVAGATVHAWWSGVRLRSTTTAADGTYVLAGLVPGTYAVSATDPSGAHDTRFHPTTANATLATRVTAAPAATTAGVDVALRPAGAIGGRVTTSAGAAVAGTPVGALDAFGGLVQRATTAADGTYAIVGLPAGSYRVLVWPTDTWAGAYAPDAQDFDGAARYSVAAGATTTGVDLVVDTPADHPVPAYQGLVSAPKVALIGDSITRNSTTVHHQRLDPQWWVSSLGLANRRTDELVAVADRYAATDPDQVVVNLGSNDAYQGVDPATVVANLTAIVDRFPDADCVHLVTITTSTGFNHFTDRAAAVNAGIRALAAARPQVRVVDWADALATNLATGGPLWSIDRLHPVGAGRQALADLVAGALEGCPTPGGRVTGTVREDLDGDGAPGPDEPGQPDVLVRAWRDGDGDGEPEVLVASTTTDADGSFDLDGLAPDDYRVAVEPDQVAPGVPSPGHVDVTVAGGATATVALGIGLPATGRSRTATTIGATELVSLRDVEVLASGDVVIAGRFDDQLVLGSGAGARTLTSAGGLDAFVTVLDPAGQPRWAERLGGTGDDDAFGLAVGPAGEVAVAGAVAGDGYAAVLEADGALRWLRASSGIGLSLGTSVAFTTDGDVVAAAAFVDRVDLGDGTALQSTGLVDSVLVVRDGDDGGVVRTTQLAGPSIDVVTSLTTGPDGRVVLSGLAVGGAELRGGGATLPLTGLGSLDALVAVVDPATGAPVAGRLLGSTAADQAMRSTVDPTTGDVYLAAQVGAGGAVIALDPALATRWTVPITATGSSLYDVAVDGGSVVVVGAFRGRLTVDGHVRYAAHGDDGLLVELDADGALVDLDVVAGGRGSDNLAAVDHGDDGGIVAVGSFTVRATMGRGAGSVAVTADGIEDGVLVRLAP